jgi:hypothetical protein
MMWSSPFAMSAERVQTPSGTAAPPPLPVVASEADLLPVGLSEVSQRIWPIWITGQALAPDTPSQLALAASSATRAEAWTLIPGVPPPLVSIARVPSIAVSSQPQPLALPLPAVPLEAHAERSRWRVDGWALWREGSGFARAPSTSRLSGYGGSQAGAMVRYRFADQSGSDPFAYARVSRALVAGGETEAAAGIGARPITGLPLTVQGELRVTDAQTRVLVRPVVLAVTELPVMRITDRIEAEAYVQAGFIGGEYATGFADGQARIDRRMARIGGAEFRLGAGAWGGAQEGVARLDVGPTASVKFDLGKVPVRLSVDYRTRVVGDAAPDTGVAVTIVGGF